LLEKAIQSTLPCIPWVIQIYRRGTIVKYQFNSSKFIRTCESLRRRSGPNESNPCDNLGQNENEKKTNKRNQSTKSDKSKLDAESNDSDENAKEEQNNKRKNDQGDMKSNPRDKKESKFKNDSSSLNKVLKNNLNL